MLPPVTDVISPGYPGKKSADWRQNFLVWIGALTALWFILQALADSGNADIARGIAGLITFGAFWKLGPGALDNARKMVAGG